MPLYEYLCDDCGHRFEVIRKFSDAPLDKCPKCGGAVRKLQSAPAFHLKGSGWYATDYGKKDVGGTDKTDKPAKKDDATAASSTDSSSTSDSKTVADAKPATDAKPTTASTTATAPAAKDS